MFIVRIINNLNTTQMKYKTFFYSQYRNGIHYVVKQVIGPGLPGQRITNSTNYRMKNRKNCPIFK